VLHFIDFCSVLNLFVILSVEYFKSPLLELREYGVSLKLDINPYNFDSADEKELFRCLRSVLNTRETVKEIYFTGGATDSSHNDFYFEYWSPEKQRIARYFPDFLVETSKGRFLVVETKSQADRADYEANKRLVVEGKVKTVDGKIVFLK